VTTTTIPVLSLADEPQHLTGELGESFRSHGFAMVRDHGIDAELIESAWRLSKAFFALDEAEKRRFHLVGKGGARGYTPFGTEIAKDAEVHDLKEFWHVGRDLPPGHPLSSSMPPNVWPDKPEGFRETFTRLYAEFDRVGLVLLRHIALNLDLQADWFDEACREGNSVLRLIHYPPLAGDPGGALRAGPHEDINLITLLLGAEEAGLELLGKDGQWHGVNPPPGGLVVNIGDMLQRLCNHVLPSTTHRVRNPLGERAGHARYSMPYFVHLRSDVLIRTLAGCADAANPDRYPEPITADDFLKQRLYEIGLLG
jgi:isopenicillin N synthase-like dioxygenase